MLLGLLAMCTGVFADDSSEFVFLNPDTVNNNYFRVQFINFTDAKPVTLNLHQKAVLYKGGKFDEYWNDNFPPLEFKPNLQDTQYVVFAWNMDYEKSKNPRSNLTPADYEYLQNVEVGIMSINGVSISGCVAKKDRIDIQGIDGTFVITRQDDQHYTCVVQP